MMCDEAEIKDSWLGLRKRAEIMERDCVCPWKEAG